MLPKPKNKPATEEVSFIAVPAVSQHIKYLEDYYGVDLIEKNSREFNFVYLKENSFMGEFINFCWGK